MKKILPLVALLGLSTTLSADLYPNIQRNNSSQRSFPYYNQGYYNQNPHTEDVEYSDTQYYYYQNPQNAQDQNYNQDGWTAESFDYSQSQNPSYYNQGTQSQGTASPGYNQNRMNPSNAANNGIQSSYFSTETVTVPDTTVRNFPQDRAVTPFDNELNKKIRDKVSSGWLKDNYKGVALKTNNGIVSLDGTIASRDDEKKLVDQISKIDGVRSVNSNLTIQK